MSAGNDDFGPDGKTVIRPSARPAAHPTPERTVIASPAPPTPAAPVRTVIASPPAAVAPVAAREAASPAQPPATYPGANPLIAAAAPLLIMLARARQAGTLPPAADVSTAIRDFQQRTAASRIPEDDARIAAYALCETADDTARALSGPGAQPWAEGGMLNAFFRTRASGTGFFEALNRLLADPGRHVDLIELMHACLALGFEGQYRGRPDALEGLRRVRADVYGTLRHLRPASATEIAPRWHGAKRQGSRSGPPLFWRVVAGLPALAVAVYLTLSYLIGREGDAAAGSLLAFSPATAVTLDRAALAPPPAPPAPAPPAPAPAESQRPQQLERVRAALTAEIGAGVLTVAPRGGEIVVTIDNALLFRPGGADLRPEFAPVAGRIAAMLDAEAGPVTIVGHTDNVQPGRDSAFRSNEELSVARAQAVGRVIAATMRDPSRLAVDGRGDVEPVADNATPEGRAANRRVDIVLSREGTP